MAITNYDGIVRVLANGQRVNWNLNSISSTVAGQQHSLWRAGGQPGAGAIPTSAEVCDKTLAGSIQFTNRTSPTLNYMPILEVNSSILNNNVLIYDRLMHLGGLSGTVTTSQAASVDLSANLSTSNLEERIGDSDYSDVEWFLEWYSNTGATVVTVTVNVTYGDDSTGDLTAVSLAATRRASFMQALNYLIPDTAAGKRIKAVNSVLLSGTTGTAGNFGVTATRYRCGMWLPNAYSLITQDWAQLGLPIIYNDSCLFASVICGSTSTGIIKASGKIGYE